MTFVIIALCLVILMCLIGLRGFCKQMQLQREFDRTVRDYLEVYSKYKEAWETDCDAEEIVELCKADGNFIQFGNKLSVMIFKNSKELRECMIAAGEYIIQYQNILQYYYGYVGKEEEVNSAFEALREIRKICLEKGENAKININVKAAT